MAKFTVTTIVEEQMNEMVYLHSPQDVANFFIGILEKMNPEEKEREHVWVAGVNGRNRILFVDLESVGLSDSSLMSPEGVFRKALIRNVRSIFLVHNHPSSVLKPSDDDVRITNRLKMASEILGIKILDHIVIGDPGNRDLVHDQNQAKPFFSFTEHHLL